MASVTALGMIETIGLVSAIEAADAGLKAAPGAPAGHGLRARGAGDGAF